MFASLKWLRRLKRLLGEGEDYSLEGYVVPSVDLIDLLEEPTILEPVVNVGAAPALVQEVPEGEEWKFEVVGHRAMAGAARFVIAYQGATVPFTTGVTAETYYDGPDVWFPGGSALRLEQGAVGDTAIGCPLFIRKRSAR